jgi:hypothetical protein
MMDTVLTVELVTAPSQQRKQLDLPPLDQKPKMRVPFLSFTMN